MIDIHNHIIYGVDDGSRSIDESLEMVNLYKKAGFSEIIATSHYDKSRYITHPDDIIKKADILNNRFEKEGIDFKIYPGQEIQVEVDTLEKIKNGEVLSLNNSRYVLCELSFASKPNFLKDLIYQMQLEGYVPIIAHAERYPYVSEDINWLLDFIKMGALIQVNYSSIKSHRDTMRRLLERNMVHIIATDAHQSKWRSPYIVECKDEIIDIVGEDKFDKLSRINPNLVIEDKYIDSEYGNIIKERKKEKRSFLRFWRKK